MVGPRIGEGFDVSQGLAYHQMDVQRQRRCFKQGTHHRWSDGDIGDEMSVHHIDVDHFHTGFFRPRDIRAQSREIGR
jgi:hypothetical protein